eukprot:RCo046837
MSRAGCVLALLVLAVAIAVPFVLAAFTRTGSISTLITNNLNYGRTRVGEFDKEWDEKTGTVDKRASAIQTLTNHYYDIVTDFYEYGWGQCFHFATRHKGESFDASIARHEFYLAHKIGIKPGMKVLDVGCGVGGPMRAIARFTGAHVTGLNNNEYQIKRGRVAVERENLQKFCDFQKGDFMKMPFPDNHFDAVYAIEATCHAPDKAGVYSEMFRVLKPGGVMGVYDWAMTDNYNSSDSLHRAIKLGIEHGDSLPDLPHVSAIPESMEKAGFEVIEHFDLAVVAEKEQAHDDVPWYLPLESHWTLTGFKHTPVGRMCTAYMLRVLEAMSAAPAGSYDTAMMLEDGAKNLALGGRLKIFTPMYFALGRKPL